MVTRSTIRYLRNAGYTPCRVVIPRNMDLEKIALQKPGQRINRCRSMQRDIPQNAFSERNQPNSVASVSAPEPALPPVLDVAKPGRRINRCRSMQSDVFQNAIAEQNQPNSVAFVSAPEPALPPVLDIAKIRSILKTPIGKPKSIFARRKSVGSRVSFHDPIVTAINIEPNDTISLIDFDGMPHSNTNPEQSTATTEANQPSIPNDDTNLNEFDPLSKTSSVENSNSKSTNSDLLNSFDWNIAPNHGVRSIPSLIRISSPYTVPRANKRPVPDLMSVTSAPKKAKFDSIGLNSTEMGASKPTKSDSIKLDSTQVSASKPANTDSIDLASNQMDYFSDDSLDDYWKGPLPPRANYGCLRFSDSDTD